MNIKQKQLNLLGLATRAKALISGDETVEKAIKQQKVYVVICASDVSQSTKERYTYYCEQYNIPLVDVFTRYEISHAIGKTRSLCAIQNKGMADKFMSYDEDNQ